MIQRIQTIYLLIALVIQSFQMTLDWVTYETENKTLTMTGIKSDIDIVSHWLLTAGVVGGFILIAVAIGTFKNRSLQLKLVTYSQLMVLVTLSFFAVAHYFNIEKLNIGGAITVNYHLTAAMPVLSFVSLLLARGGIKRDEALVRSVDRLR